MSPRPQLDPSLPVPLYRQLHQQLRDFIRNGHLGDGARLPATRELAGQLGLNRTTIAAAYDLLEAEGLIKGHVGRGSFVHSPVESTRDWDRLLSRAEIESAPATAVSISFARSQPSADLFPLAAFRRSAEAVISDPGLTGILQLGSPFGFEPLREMLLGQLQPGPGDDLLITNGCQQALDLLRRVLIQPGDPVFIEDPVYPGLRALFEEAGARITGIPMLPRGLDLDELERQIRRERPKLIVVTPSFQNPTGLTLDMPAREALLKLAAQHGVILIENDVYAPLRYEGQGLPALKSLDPDVIQLGSFSKVAFPGLRVGWMLAPRAVTARCAQAKQWSDLHTDQLSQAILWRFAVDGHLEEHRERVIEAGAERLAAILEACAKHLPAGWEFTRPLGGMNLWVRSLGQSGIDSEDLLRKATAEDVCFTPGRYFAVGRPDPSSFRLSFAGLAPDKIRQGLRVLGQILEAMLDGKRRAGRPAPAQALV